MGVIDVHRLALARSGIRWPDSQPFVGRDCFLSKRSRHPGRYASTITPNGPPVTRHGTFGPRAGYRTPTLATVKSR